MKVDFKINVQPTEINNNKHKDCSMNEKLNNKLTNEPEVGKAARGTPHSRHDVKQGAHSRTKRTHRRSKKNITKVFLNFILLAGLCHQTYVNLNMIWVIVQQRR